MPWDEQPFQDYQGLMDIERSVPQSIDAVRQKMGYAYNLKLLKRPPIRKQIQSDLPAFNQLQDQKSRRVGLWPSTDVDEKMKQLRYFVAGKLHRDIQKVIRLIHLQSAADWLKEKKLDKKGWTAASEDLDNDVSTLNDAVVRIVMKNYIQSLVIVRQLLKRNIGQCEMKINIQQNKIVKEQQ
ncbi:MAG: hypothetical protein EZS28_006321 [Streblomastix strix]|uniref:Uncharacterized protein n=1 Tax=Streblomastix strix TaxID=222440 RepID=A0A5J4WT61_9EUKA|nr:MAG: hypothetical protein EZS28_006321 [Streblomastix strix]